MKREDLHQEKSSPLNLAAAFIVLYAAVFINFTYGAGMVPILLYAAGSVFYIIYIKLNCIGFRYNSDYIQSGEASIALLAAVITSVWFTDTIFILLPVVILAIFVSDIFINKVMIKKGNESFAAGTYINITAAILLSFFLFKVPGLDSHLITNMLFGHLVSSGSHSGYLPVLASAALASALLYRLLIPELLIFSHGSNYFRTTGMNYSGLKTGIALFRSAIFALTFLLLGVAGGTALYIHWPGRGRQYQIEFTLMTLAYTQVIIVLTIYLDKRVAAAVSLALSYIIFILLNRRRIYLYDRS